MRKNLKQLLEERESFAYEAKDLWEIIESNRREWTAAEQARFMKLTDEGTGLIDQLTAEIEEEKERNKQILAISRQKHEGVLNMPAKHGLYEQVLPVNGVLPGDSKQRYNPFVRKGPLKAFASEQSAFDSGQWLKAVVARAFHNSIDRRAEDYVTSIGLEVSNAAYEGSGTAGGYTVPAPVSAAIINILETVGVARQACRVLPTSSDTLSVPKKIGGLTAYVVNEMQAMTESDSTWGLVTGAVKKRACLSYLSQELNDDSLINMADFIFSEMGYALALKEDDELCNGDGSSTDGGILGLISSIGSAGVYTCDANENLWSEIDIEDCISTIGKLPDRYFTYGPKWLCSYAFYNQVMARLSYAVGGVTASEVLNGTGNVRSFLGYPVLLTSQMPTAQADSSIAALFGSFDQGVLFADRGDMRISRSDDFKFSEDLISLKATHRYDMTIHDAGDSSNAGAYVALKTNAA